MKKISEILDSTSIKLGVLVLSSLLILNSCTKEENLKTEQVDKDDLVQVEDNGIVRHNVYYKGETFQLIGKRNKDGKSVDYEFIPEELKEWNKSGEEEVVQHALIYDDRTEVYLFDSREEHAKMFTFADGNINRLKGPSEASIRTYSNVIGSSYSGVLKNRWSDFWGLRCFGNFWSYGDGTAYNPQENDQIVGIRLESTNGRPRTQFVACRDANWGGARLYITKVTTGTFSYARMYDYNWTFAWVFKPNWAYEISSYELFQTDAFLSGQRI